MHALSPLDATPPSRGGPGGGGGARRGAPSSAAAVATPPPHPCARKQWRGGPSAAAASATSASSTLEAPPLKQLVMETTEAGLERVKYDTAGWNWWTTASGIKVHYCAAGPIDGPPVLLVHGYGASAYHWRYNIPSLAAKGHRVFAVCMIGFGWSEKALVNYNNGGQWIKQLSGFIEEVIWKERRSHSPGQQPPQVVLVGNSLGGYASLAAAAARPDLIRGVALLNGAGPFDSPDKPPEDPSRQQTVWEQAQIVLSGLVKRVVLLLAFLRAKQPARIRQVLELVYINKAMLDDDLVDSIVQPAEDPQAAEVFYRINHRTTPPLTLNALLKDLKVPLLLLWGMKDPWITPAKGEAIRALYPERTTFVGLPEAGHCPHDDDPQASNEALAKWLAAL